MIYAVIDTNVLVSALITHNSLSATAKVVRLLLDGVKTIEGLSDTDLLKLEFWNGFNDAMSNNDEFKHHFRARKASPQHWYDLSIGSSAYHICLTINTQKQCIGADIYIDDDKELFAQFKSHKDEITAMLNSEVDWREAKKACRICISTDINPKKREAWPKAYNWFLEKAIVYKEIANKYGK
jgi:cellulose biosynthesis protein BcsQ